MRQIIFLSFLFLNFNLKAQDSTVYQAFDFWLGEWEANWIDAEGNMMIGSNTISKDLDGKVIRESFSHPASNYQRTSISVFNQSDSTWRQAWADNTGNYVDFKGVVSDGIRVFQAEAIMSGEEKVIRRMIFYNIQPDSFDWDWEISKDGGKTWKLSWQINYLRKK